MDPIQKLNDGLKQQAHADKIKARTDERNQSLEAMVFRMVEQAVQRAFAGFTIQSGNCMNFSGSGRNITGAWVPPPAPPMSATAVCNADGTISITITS